MLLTKVPTSLRNFLSAVMKKQMIELTFYAVRKINIQLRLESSGEQSEILASNE